MRGEADVAERRERIGGDGDLVVLAHGDERGHAGRLRGALGVEREFALTTQNAGQAQS